MTGRNPRIACGASVLRPWSTDDADALAKHANDPEVSRFLRDRFPSPYRREDAERFLAVATAADAREISWAIEIDGEAVGGIALIPGEDVERFSAELGYWLARPWWRRGIMTAAVRTVTEHAFGELGLLRIWAVTFVANPASAGVLARAGFVEEGMMRSAAVKRGEVCDLVLWARVNPGWMPLAPRGSAG